MANENKNINELVSDDEDPTAELDASTVRRALREHDDDAEADANTFDFDNLRDNVDDGISVDELQSDLKARSDTIDRLQFDVQQLHAKWLGLEAEIKGREEATLELTAELKSVERKLKRKEELVGKRDSTIKSLKAEISERDEKNRELQKLANEYLATKTELEGKEELIGQRDRTIKSLKAELREGDQRYRELQALSDEYLAAKTELEGIEELVGQRDRTIRSLEAEIRERDQKHRELQALADEYLAAKTELEFGDEVNKARQKIREFEWRIADYEATLNALRAQQSRTESYADDVRRKFSMLSKDSEGAFVERDKLRDALEQANCSIASLQAEVDDSRAVADAVARSLQEERSAHEQELRTLRFELSDAQNTLSDRDQLSEELAAQLVDTRNTKVELESMLEGTSCEYQQHVENLEKQIERQKTSIAELEQKLEDKGEAINQLLAEVAKKSKELESIGAMEDVIQEIDHRMSERIDDRDPMPAERVTRLLVGRIDQQELRFPLFNDRLTIGRAAENDIQLKAQHISRRHAVVATEGDVTRVIDWGSKNGVYVNSKRVSEQPLRHGDILTIGTAKFRFEERPKRDR